jgi:hypothetical protein
MNGGNAIISPKNNVAGLYGAGEPSVFHHEGLFYMLYTDTSTHYPARDYYCTQDTSKPPDCNMVFVLRSPDPTFQTAVEELRGTQDCSNPQNPSGWVSLQGQQPARTFTPFQCGMSGLDWRFDDAATSAGNVPGLVAVAMPVYVNGQRNMILVNYYDQNLFWKGRIEVSGIWTQGPGLVRRPDGHAPPGPLGTYWVPLDIVRPVSDDGNGNPSGLGHVGLDYNSWFKLNPTVSLKLPTVSMESLSPIPTTVNSITLTAEVADNPTVAATGTVEFWAGSSQLGGGVSLTTVNGVRTASLSVARSSLTLGDNTIWAHYLGDANYNSSFSPSIGQAVISETQLGAVINVSTRAHVLTGNDTMFGGFIVGGASPKSVAIVATGPSLANYGITNPLLNPTVTLFDSPNISNDNWQQAPNAGAIQAAGFAPADPNESAIMMDLAPGAHTAQVQGVGGGTGISVLGIYPVGGLSVPFINLSTRAWVGTGNSVMIAGFVIKEPMWRTVVIQGTGPSLAAYGIANPLQNPKITLVRSSDQAVLATNDDWKNRLDAGWIKSVGLAPTHDQESVIMMTLAPGAYTVILEGVSGGTGVGVLGVYPIPPGF